MIQISARKEGNKQLVDNTIRPLDENVSRVELAEFQMCLKALCLEFAKRLSRESPPRVP